MTCLALFGPVIVVPSIVLVVVVVLVMVAGHCCCHGCILTCCNGGGGDGDGGDGGGILSLSMYLKKISIKKHKEIIKKTHLWPKWWEMCHLGLFLSLPPNWSTPFIVPDVACLSMLSGKRNKKKTYLFAHQCRCRWQAEMWWWEPWQICLWYSTWQERLFIAVWKELYIYLN